MRHPTHALVALSLTLLASPDAGASPGLRLGSGFAFQGRLEQGDGPAQGAYDFELELYAGREGGAALGTQTILDAPVEQGVFALELDFGRALLELPEAWLAVRVREAGSGEYTELAPRQQVSATTTTTCVIDSLAVAESVGVGMTTAPVASNLEVRGPESDGATVAAMVVKSGAGLGAQTLLVDGDEIDVFSLSNLLNLNRNSPGSVSLAAGGGDVGVGTQTPAARLHVTGGDDAEPGGGGFLVLGDVGSGNLALDNNEIMARNDGVPTTLFLNNDGGDVRAGGSLDIGLQVLVSAGCIGGSAWVDCPVGTKVITGGCTGGTLVESYPSNGSLAPGTARWHCSYDHCNFPGDTAVVLCGRIK